MSRISALRTIRKTFAGFTTEHVASGSSTTSLPASTSRLRPRFSSCVTFASSQSYVRVTEVERWKVNQRTGEITKRTRKVNRKHQYLKNQTHGYLAVNDGASTARDIARLLGGDPPPYRRSDVVLVS